MGMSLRLVRAFREKTLGPFEFKDNETKEIDVYERKSSNYLSLEISLVCLLTDRLLASLGKGSDEGKIIEWNDLLFLIEGKDFQSKEELL